MTTDQLISKAIHCLKTGQPNLAKLYLRNAQAKIDETRISLRTSRINRVLHQLGVAMANVGKQGANAGDAVLAMAASLHDARSKAAGVRP